MKLITAGTLWMILSGIAGLAPQSVSIPTPQISTPSLQPVLESVPQKKNPAPSFLSQLEENWQSERLLAVSA